MKDIAEHAGVLLSAVSNWRTRHDDFPSPHVDSGKELFDTVDVTNWLRQRKIPQNRRRPEEPPGSSYGDRLQRNVEGLAGRTAPGGAAEGWKQRLWEAMHVLRGTHDVASSLWFLLGFVYVRTQRPDVWQSVVNAPGWSEAHNLLSEVALEAGPGAPAIAVFRTLPRTGEHALFEAVRIVDTIDFRADEGPDSTGARLGEVILDNLERGMGRGGGQLTPPDVARCLVELLDPKQTDTVYDPFCGSGELLVAAAEHVDRRDGSVRDLRMYGQTPQEWSWLTSRMNLALHGFEADLSTPSHALEEDRFPQRRFDMVLANPPFNQQMTSPEGHAWPFGKPARHSANLAWLQHVVTKLAVGGRGAVVMPPNVAFLSGRSEVRIRQAMVDAGVIECLISLPGNLFRFTGTATTVWILRAPDDPPSHSNTLFIDAQVLGKVVDRVKRTLDAGDTARIVEAYRGWRARSAQEDFVEIDGFARAVSRDEIRANDYVLAPSRYLGAVAESQNITRVTATMDSLRDELDELSRRAYDVDGELKERLSALVSGPPSRDGQFVALGSICDVSPGPGNVSRNGHESDWTPLVLPRNIKDNRVLHEDLDVVPPTTAGRLTRYELAAGDIVTARTGTLGRYGQVSEDESGWLLGPGCVRFRPGDRVNPGYLLHYLGGPDGRRWVAHHAAGKVIPHINATTWREMPVWLPPTEIQRSIVETLRPFSAAAAVHRRISATSGELQDLLVAMLTRSGRHGDAETTR